MLTLELLFKGDFQFTEIFHWNFYLVQTLTTEPQFSLAMLQITREVTLMNLQEIKLQINCISLKLQLLFDLSENTHPGVIIFLQIFFLPKSKFSLLSLNYFTDISLKVCGQGHLSLRFLLHFSQCLAHVRCMVVA